MRFLILLLPLLVAACLVSANPINSKMALANYPSVKGSRRQHEVPNQEPKKGEYICRGEICRLEPGRPPANCDDCQYPTKLFRHN